MTVYLVNNIGIGIGNVLGGQVGPGGAIVCIPGYLFERNCSSQYVPLL